MSGTTLQYTETVTIWDCCSCGGPIALTPTRERELRRTHELFYCPKGHSQSFQQKSDGDLLKEERDRTTRLRGLLDDERSQHHRTEMRLRGMKGALVRTKRRIAEGACPRCHKRFPDLKAHIEHEHPDYAPASA